MKKSKQVRKSVRTRQKTGSMYVRMSEICMILLKIGRAMPPHARSGMHIKTHLLTTRYIMRRVLSSAMLQF
jgi:hypothetical protein